MEILKAVQISFHCVRSRNIYVIAGFVIGGGFCKPRYAFALRVSRLDHGSNPSVNGKQVVFAAVVLIESRLDHFHSRKHLFLLQSLSNNLHTNRKTGHANGIIMLIRSACDSVKLRNTERRRQRIDSGRDVRDGEDACSIFELIL